MKQRNEFGLFNVILVAGLVYVSYCVGKNNGAKFMTINNFLSSDEEKDLA